jgi:RND superfamily putative drug exporter
MSSALYALGRWAVRRRRLVVALWVGALIALAGIAGVLHTGTNDVFTIPGTQSQVALDALAERFPQFAGATGQVVVTAPAGTKVTDEAVTSRIVALTQEYAAAPHVRAAVSPFDEHVRGAVSADASAAIISVQMDTESAQVTQAMRDPILRITADSTTAGLPAEVGGSLFLPTPPQMSIVEGTGVLIALVVLVVTFGSALAAGIPLLTSVVGVAASMTFIMAATRFTDVTSTAPFLALMIGLAVGIDYALFILSRHRDLLAVGHPPDEAAAQATGTAGSAVVFAGATVAIALAALGVARIPFLTVMGLAGAVAVGCAVLASLTLLPAVIGLCGARLTPRRVGGAHHESRASGLAARWVALVTKVPALTAVVVIAGLAVMALPARDLSLALTNNGSSALDSTQRKAFDTVAAKFGAGANAPLVITLDILASTDPLGVVSSVEKRIQATEGVSATTVATPNASADTGVVVAIPTAGADTSTTKDTLARVRGLAPDIKRDYGVDMAVTGQTAAQVDISQRLFDALAPFGLVVVGLSLVLLLLVFRSVVVPVTAALGYVLSVGAAFGTTSAVFEWGWFGSAVGLTQTGPVISFMPIIVMGVLFGLAMDYQVFLVSSMRSRYVHEGGARQAIETGFIDAARVVTAAGFIMCSVFAAFVPRGATYIKPIALGLAVGVFVDAFLVRMTLIPAVMRLLGEAAWWLPRWLDRRLPVLDVEGESLHRRLEAAQARAADQDPPVILASDLGLRNDDGPVFEHVEATVRVGSVLLVHGEPGLGTTSLLLTFAGRMGFTQGRLEVAGRLLPDQAGQVRRSTALAELAGVNDLDPRLTVADHIDEQLATTTWHPWVTQPARLRVHARIDGVLAAALAAAPDLPVQAHLDPARPVRALAPLERWVLALALALVDDPQVVLIDDLDDLPGPDERHAAWAAVASLAAGQGGRDARPITVVAACRDGEGARAALHGIPVVEVTLAGRGDEPATPPPAPGHEDPPLDATDRKELVH